MARAVGYAEGVATYTGNLAALALDREDWPAPRPWPARPCPCPKTSAARN